jgi:hypothetical protein
VFQIWEGMENKSIFRGPDLVFWLHYPKKCRRLFRGFHWRSLTPIKLLTFVIGRLQKLINFILCVNM